MSEQLLPEPVLCAHLAVAVYDQRSHIEVHSATPRYDIPCNGRFGARQLVEAIGLGHDWFIINGTMGCGGEAVTLVRGTAVCAGHATIEALGHGMRAL